MDANPPFLSRRGARDRGGAGLYEADSPQGRCASPRRRMLWAAFRSYEGRHAAPIGSAGEGDPVEGERGEVIEEGTQAVGGHAVGGGAVAAFCLAPGETLAGLSLI